MRRAAALAAGLLAGSLLVFNTAARRDDIDYSDMAVYRRLWADLAVGTRRFLEGRIVGDLGPDRPESIDPTAAYRAIIVEKVVQLGIAPHQFWRAIRPQPFARERGQVRVAEYDDQG